jgi:hypothetical protein
MSKRERIEFLLDHRGDFYDPAGTNAGGESEGIGLTLMPRMSRHPSVKELERCIELLRATARGHCTHMLAYYGAEWRIVWTPVKAKKGRMVLADDGRPEMAPERRRIVPAWVLPRMVERGVDYVTFTFKGEAFIPDELLLMVA